MCCFPPAFGGLVDHNDINKAFVFWLIEMDGPSCLWRDRKFFEQLLE